MKVVEKQVDEARQREMKGTLIVSSPNRGDIRSVAVRKSIYWPDMDMVLRLVYEKYGVRIPYSDVAASHRFGKKENNTFVLKIWNRKPYSAWEMLTKAMLAGKEVGRKNIFINFMLTAKRIELSKLVRQAKKDNQIQKYSIDQNGKIFVIKTGENDYKEVTCVDDINS